MAIRVVLSIVLLITCTVLLRTAFFKPKENKIEADQENIEFDYYKAVNNLQKLVRCETVSYTDTTLENKKEFERLISLLPKLYPNLHKAIKPKKFPGRGLLYVYRGKTSDNPAIFMAHYDVVPVNKKSWTKPPFDALIEKNIMWGRGTLDTKNTFNGILSAADALISQGFIPEHDIYLAFTGSEETTGLGAQKMVEYFKENHIEPSFILDEGGAVISDAFPGIIKPCGMVGIAEKGIADIKLSVKSNGGHASAPGLDTPISILSKACLAIESHPFSANYKGPTKSMFNELWRHSTDLYRMIFSNLWLFGWTVSLYAIKKNSQLNSFIRTTNAFTQAKGSDASNVIPNEAELVINTRINPNESIDYVLAKLKDIVNDSRVEISLIDGNEPSRVSDTKCEAYINIKKAIEQTWGDVIVVPYLTTQASDSRFYNDISDKIYRFSAADMSSKQIESIHGDDENIKTDTIGRAVEFFIRIMKKC